MKLNDNEVIKADELISRLHKYCFVNQMKTGEKCGFTDSDFDFLHDFINRQKAEIERLEEILGKRCEKCTAKIEAYKEFAMRLKEFLLFNRKRERTIAVVTEREIDNLVKEMTEGNDNA